MVTNFVRRVFYDHFAESGNSFDQVKDFPPVLLTLARSIYDLHTQGRAEGQYVRNDRAMLLEFALCNRIIQDSELTWEVVRHHIQNESDLWKDGPSEYLSIWAILAQKNMALSRWAFGPDKADVSPFIARIAGALHFPVTAPRFLSRSGFPRRWLSELVVYSCLKEGNISSLTQYFDNISSTEPLTETMLARTQAILKSYLDSGEFAVIASEHTAELQALLGAKGARQRDPDYSTYSSSSSCDSEGDEFSTSYEEEYYYDE